MNGTMSIKAKLEPRGKRRSSPLPEGVTDVDSPRRGRIPRVAKLLALAHRFQWLLDEGVVKDYAELARLGQVTRARITQIMNLLNLSPEIQEEILFLPPMLTGRDRPTERQLRNVLSNLDWSKQRRGQAMMNLPSP